MAETEAQLAINDFRKRFSKDKDLQKKASDTARQALINKNISEPEQQKLIIYELIGNTPYAVLTFLSQGSQVHTVYWSENAPLSVETKPDIIDLLGIEPIDIPERDFKQLKATTPPPHAEQSIPSTKSMSTATLRQVPTIQEIFRELVYSQYQVVPDYSRSLFFLKLRDALKFFFGSTTK